MKKNRPFKTIKCGARLRKRFAVVALTALALLLCATYLFCVQSGVKETTSYEVTGGMAVGGIAADLKKSGYIGSANALKLSVYGFGGRAQAGIYDLPRGASVWRIARMLARGDIASTVVIIPEGLTVRQIVEVLDGNGFLSGRACASLCPPEGALFPDTYRVAKGTSRASVIELMRKKMREVKHGWEASGRHAPRPLKTWNEVVTLASIVQKETPKVAEMPAVASVYLNRLRARMRLQADPTVVYAITNQLGDMRGAPLLTEHLQTDSPYNTYKHRGLPPSPIANPGQEAITAVLNPDNTDYLFFVADGQGGHNFSRDYEEHKENRAKWREIKKGR